MPKGYPKRGKKYRYQTARIYLDVRKIRFEELIRNGLLPPDGKLPTGERFWYADTLDKSPIKGLNYRRSEP